MKCIECGKSVPENAKYCKHCGAPVKAAEPSSFAQPREDVSFSPVNDSFPVSQSDLSPVMKAPPTSIPTKKRRFRVPLIAGGSVFFVVLLVALGLIYNDNYKSLLSSMGFEQKMDSSETTAATTTQSEVPSVFETQTSIPTDTTQQSIADTTAENVTQPLTTSLLPTAPPNSTGATSLYKVVTESGLPLRIRSGPSEEHEQIGKVKNGNTVLVRQVVDGWANVEYNGVVGWSSLQFLQPIE